MDVEAVLEFNVVVTYFQNESVQAHPLNFYSETFLLAPISSAAAVRFLIEFDQGIMET